MRIDGRRAIVTGAASGIGAAIARRYAGAGASVCVADLAFAGARRVAQELGAGAIAVHMDVTSEAGVEASVAQDDVGGE